MNAGPGAARPSRARRVALVSLGLIATVLLVAGLALARLVLRSPYAGRAPRPFEREAWLDACDDPAGERFLMVTDLLRRRLLTGLTLTEAEELLGAPADSMASFLGPCWYLGPEDSVLAIDSAWLVVDLEGERITGGRVVTD